MVCGQFFGSWFNVNLVQHDATDWQANLELMLHALATRLSSRTIISATGFMRRSNGLGETSASPVTVM
jgi:hypothetical protein